MDKLQQFYNIMLACGMLCPPYEAWHAAATDNAELWPIERDGKMIGGVLFKGQGVHIAIHPDWHQRWVTRDMLRALPTWQHPGNVVADIRADNLPAQKLALKVGFTLDSKQGLYNRYLKESPCKT